MGRLRKLTKAQAETRRRVAALGGKRKTAKKLAAVKKNLRAAMRARYPKGHPKWNPGALRRSRLARKMKARKEHKFCKGCKGQLNGNVVMVYDKVRQHKVPYHPGCVPTDYPQILS